MSFSLTLRRGHCHPQVDLGCVKWQDYIAPLLLQTVSNNALHSHTVNKEGKVSHSWVIANVSDPYRETFWLPAMFGISPF